MLKSVKKLIRTAVTGGIIYYLATEKREETKEFLNKVLPDGVKSEIERFKEDQAAMQELFQATNGNPENMARLMDSDIVQNMMGSFSDMMKSGNIPHVEVSKEVFTPREVENLMEQLAEDAMGCAIRVMLKTGITMPEMLALTPGSIQSDGSVIQVKSEVKVQNGKVTVVPLDSGRVRVVEVPPEVQKFARKLSESAGKYIWEGKTKGQPLLPSQFTKLFKDHIGEVPEVRILSPECTVNTWLASF